MQNKADTFQVLFSKGSKKSLQKLPRAAQLKIARQILLLQQPIQVTQSRALVNHASATHRLRVGDYRVLYDVYSADKVVMIVRIGHRKDIYR